MFDNVFIFAGLVAVLYLVLKVLEMKYIDKDFKPVKTIVRDVFIVFVCSLSGAFVSFKMNGTIHDFFNVITQTKVLNNDQAQIFTGEPGF